MLFTNNSAPVIGNASSVAKMDGEFVIVKCYDCLASEILTETEFEDKYPDQYFSDFVNDHFNADPCVKCQEFEED